MGKKTKRNQPGKNQCYAIVASKSHNMSNAITQMAFYLIVIAVSVVTAAPGTTSIRSPFQLTTTAHVVAAVIHLTVATALTVVIVHLRPAAGAVATVLLVDEVFAGTAEVRRRIVRFSVTAAAVLPPVVHLSFAAASVRSVRTRKYAVIVVP